MKLRHFILILGLGSAVVATGCEKKAETAEEEKKPEKKEKKEKKKDKKAKKPKLKLDKKEYGSGEAIKVTFKNPLPEDGGKYWITLAKADSPETTWGAWHMVKAGSTEETLKTTEGGDFEVRLHGGYPKKSHNIIAKKKVKVGGEASVLAVDGATFKVGDTIPVKFTKDLPKEEGQYWITITKPDDPDTTWGKWHMVKDGAKSDEVKALEAGPHEVRLHGGYPKKKHNVIARKPVTIQ